MDVVQSKQTKIRDEIIKLEKMLVPKRNATEEGEKEEIEIDKGL